VESYLNILVTAQILVNGVVKAWFPGYFSARSCCFSP
jgi:hypothetical protein